MVDYSIKSGDKVVVSKDSRSVVKGLVGVVSSVNYKSPIPSDNDEIIVSASGLVGFVRRKFVTKYKDSVGSKVGFYALTKVPVVGSDDRTRQPGLAALITDIDEDGQANIVYIGEFATVHIDDLDLISKRRPEYFGEV